MYLDFFGGIYTRNSLVRKTKELLRTFGEEAKKSCGAINIEFKIDLNFDSNMADVKKLGLLGLIFAVCWSFVGFGYLFFVLSAVTYALISIFLFKSEFMTVFLLYPPPFLV